MKKTKHKLTKVSAFHYFRLVFRSSMFLSVLIWYIFSRIHGTGNQFWELSNIMKNPVLIFVWIAYMAEMVLRMVPFPLESPGCQKQFPKFYKPTGRVDVVLHDDHAVLIGAIIWVLFNAIFGKLYHLGIMDEGMMFLLCLAYSICDIICILFFCPFQTWLFKNRCCVSCRIYNWDYAMMFTPFYYIPSIYTWSLLTMALIIFVRWEITAWKFPERFSENTNAYLACKNCTEKLCVHKKQLKSFKKELEHIAKRASERILKS